jgi:carbonic anhydrase
LGLINKWLRNIKEVFRYHRDELEAIADEGKQLDRLTELNVIEQCNDLVKTSIIQKAWKARKAPVIHGWVYRLSDGIVQELVNIPADLEGIDPLFRYDV